MQRQPMDRVFPATRVLGAVIFLALVPTVLLWVRPNDTSHWFAWTIHPSMTPLIMGAGYLCGAYFFARVVFARQWHHVGLGFLPIGVFATFMGIATFTHLDRFDDSHGAYWLWIFLYATMPFVVPIVWALNRREDPGVLDRGDVFVPAAVRTTLKIVGVGELVLAAALLVSPSTMIDIWPWKLTALTAQVLGGWFALPGLVALLMGIDGRWSAIRIPLQSQLIGISLMLLAAPRGWNDFDTGNVVTYLFLGGLALQLVGAAALYLYMHRLARRMPDPATPVEVATASPL